MATESLPDRAPATPSDRARVEPRRGMRLGRYELLIPIARGGMAEVWAARQTGQLGFRRIVALKTIRPEHAETVSFRRMFLDEAAIAARIHHTNVVEVLDLGEEGPVVFQAMTLVEGDTLAGLVKRWQKTRKGTGLPPAVALRLMADALAGLHAAHELTDEDGIPLRLVHRDISPQNILVGIDGVAKLADFGIAKALGRLADETEAGQLKGKFSYLAPEALARRPHDRRSDIFSAGVVLWEALTGERLFRGVDLLDTIARRGTYHVPDPRESVPSLPDDVARVTLRALAQSPDDRYTTAAEMSDAIEAAARASGLVVSPTEVAAFVSELVGADVERQREEVRDACRTGPGPSSASAVRVPAAAVAETLQAATLPNVPAPPAPTRLRVAHVLLALGGLSALAVVAAIARAPAPPASATAETALPGATAIALAPAPSLAPALAPSLAPALAPSLAPALAPSLAPAPALASPPARSASPTPHTARVPGQPPSSPRPKFGNPY